MALSFTYDQFANRISILADRKVPEAIERVLERAGDEVEGAAKARCPVRTGYLRESHFHEVVAGVGYVGARAPYAAQVHNDYTAHHTNGEAGFLLTALVTTGPEALMLAAKELLDGG